MTLLHNNVRDGSLFSLESNVAQNLAQVFQFGSIKKRFHIIWESEANRNTRMSIPIWSQWPQKLKSCLYFSMQAPKLHLNSKNDQKKVYTLDIGSKY